jgi:amino-acid N-acetyltransferase
MSCECVIRKAVFDAELPPDAPQNADVMAIHDLLKIYAEDRLLLPRPPEDILEKIRNFRIAEVNGEFAGCAALRDYGNSLYEVRSLAVKKEFTGQRIGSRLVSGFVDEMKAAGAPAKIFALTYRAEFFRNLGFQIVTKDLFPEKIWSDCILCPKLNCCDETAVLLSID